MISAADAQPLIVHLEKLHSDALYSAQTYFEASKRIAANTKFLIFGPSCVGAISGFLIAIGAPSWLGAASAMAGIMSATASYIGVDRKGSAYLRSAQQFTQLRHRSKSVKNLALQCKDLPELKRQVDSLEQEYAAIIGSTEPTSNRDYEKANARIKAGVFDYT